MTKRNKLETIEYFKQLSYDYELKGNRENDIVEKEKAFAKSEAYELTAFQLENNME